MDSFTDFSFAFFIAFHLIFLFGALIVSLWILREIWRSLRELYQREPIGEREPLLPQQEPLIDLLV